MNHTCYPKNCGNLIIDDSESCDDGNRISGDGCSNYCIIEYAYYCNVTDYNYSACE